MVGSKIRLPGLCWIWEIKSWKVVNHHGEDYRLWRFSFQVGALVEHELLFFFFLVLITNFTPINLVIFQCFHFQLHNFNFVS